VAAHRFESCRARQAFTTPDQSWATGESPIGEMRTLNDCCRVSSTFGRLGPRTSCVSGRLTAETFHPTVIVARLLDAASSVFQTLHWMDAAIIA
jgi:hypothetical protein